MPCSLCYFVTAALGNYLNHGSGTDYTVTLGSLFTSLYLVSCDVKWG